MVKTTLLLAVISLVAVGSVVAAYATMLATDPENKTETASTGHDIAPASNASFAEPEADLSTPEIEPNFGDGSICADYEEGEVPPAHLECDDENNTTETSEGNETTAIITIQSDRKEYLIPSPDIDTGKGASTVVVSGKIGQDLIELDGQVYVRVYTSDLGRYTSGQVEVNRNSGNYNYTFEINERGIGGATAAPGEWTVTVTHIKGQAHAETTFDVYLATEKVVDNMPTVVGRQPDITGPAADQCREPLEQAFIVILKTEEFMEFSYISEYVQEVYCNDVHVVIPGILYNHIGYVLQSNPERVYLNPAAYQMYSSGPEVENLAIILFHEARHLEQYKECKADKSLCMTSEERENDAIRFESEMRQKIFPYQGDDDDHVIVIPPMETAADIVILNNGTETITPRTDATISVLGNESNPHANMTLSYDATTNTSTRTIID